MIIDLQRRIAEIGRIRIGQQVPAGKGTRPTKLDTFRLTSPDRGKIVNAAELYGGTPVEWQAPAGKQWEVITDTDSLPVIVPPGDIAFSQHFELWSAGGCQRRCDGVTESIGDQPCVCDPDNRECNIHTRLSVMLRDLNGLGVWRIDTQGYYAAVELQGAVEVVKMAAGQGRMLPATLRLEQRAVKRAGQTRRFAVPVLDIDVTPAQLLGGNIGVTEIEEPPRRELNGSSSLTPVPAAVPERPAASIAEQAAAVKPRRKGSQIPIPATGIKPRTVQQAATKTMEDIPPPEEPDEQTELPLIPITPAASTVDNPALISVDLTSALTGEQLRAAEALNPYAAGSDMIVQNDISNEPAPINEKQLKLMLIRFKERGINDRQERIDYCKGLIRRDIESSKELTVNEASLIIDSLES